MKISELVKEAYATAKDKGWHDVPATFGDRIALMHSELSEALEEFRKPFEDVTTDNFAEWSQDDGKPEGVPSELADVVIRIADACGYYGIDLEKAILKKLAYNKTRPYRHGGKAL